MTAQEPPSSQSPWRWRLLAFGLIIASAGLHVAYLVRDCPLDLAADEAHYWDWSRNLDWSYYSKGPLVALLIRGSCELFAGWSEAVCGSPMIAIRLPAVVCGALLLASLYVLTVQTLRSEKLAAAVVAGALTLPIISAGSSLMTIDAPFTACWGWALVAGHRAAVRGSTWAWPVAGLLVGVGILAKYTMVLWLPSMALFLLTSHAAFGALRKPGFWVAAGIAAVCCLPILVWNIRNDWVTLRHVGWQAGVQQRVGVRWLGPLTFVGGQAALLLGFWFACWAAAMWAQRPGRASAMGHRYLWWMSAPTFVVFLLASIKTSGQLNWAVTAYLSGAVLTAGWLRERLGAPLPHVERFARLGTAAACALGIALTIAVHYPAVTRPVLLSIAGPPSDKHPMPLRRFDPTCRLRGWRTLAAEVDCIRADLRAAGIDPVLAGAVWTLPGVLGVYCSEHPTVYSVGLPSGDRHSQYDLWRPSPVSDPGVFQGRTFVIVGDVSPAVLRAFVTVEAPRRVVYAEGGQPVAAWAVTVCRGFRGFESDRPAARY